MSEIDWEDSPDGMNAYARSESHADFIEWFLRSLEAALEWSLTRSYPQ
jgi:hypothetical protein